jgi:FKBP-type peptidyl-prolyl cis-trans isomerase
MYQSFPGLTEALGQMRRGDFWKLAIPANLAYGPRSLDNGIFLPDDTLVEFAHLSAPPDESDP